MSQGYRRFSRVNFFLLFSYQTKKYYCYYSFHEKFLQSIKTHASYLQRRIFEQIVYPAKVWEANLYNDRVNDRVSRNKTSWFLQEVILGVCLCIKPDCEWGKIKKENYFGEIQKEVWL